jgi:hypothetical protein
MHSFVLFMDINILVPEILFTQLLCWTLLFLSMSQQTVLSHALLIIETARSLSDTHTHSLGRTPLDEWLPRSRDLYLTTNNTHKRQTSMRSAGFEPVVPVSKRPQTHSLDRAATGIGWNLFYPVIFDSLYILWLTYILRLKNSHFQLNYEHFLHVSYFKIAIR